LVQPPEQKPNSMKKRQLTSITVTLNQFKPLLLQPTACM
jgi:hypothetical protein